MRRLLCLLLPLCAACQAYDFEPTITTGLEHRVVRDAAFGLGGTPRLLFVLDKSGSMELPLSAGCTGACATRWQETTRALDGFLGAHPTAARMGLLAYPHPTATSRIQDACTLPQLDATAGLAVEVSGPEEAEMRASAEQIRLALTALRPGGGTPTAATLRLLETYPPLLSEDGRQDVVVLVTDGLPNCNAALAGDTCTCVTASSCTASNLGCLDDDETVRAVAALRARGIKTAVVGFGEELAGPVAARVLDAMAEAGDLARCSGTGCTRQFYAANSAEELSAALTSIRERIAEPCVVPLGEPIEEGTLIGVEVDGVPLPPSPELYVYQLREGTPVVELKGPVCERIRAASQDAPVRYEIHLVRPL